MCVQIVLSYKLLCRTKQAADLQTVKVYEPFPDSEISEWENIRPAEMEHSKHVHSPLTCSMPFVVNIAHHAWT